MVSSLSFIRLMCMVLIIILNDPSRKTGHLDTKEGRGRGGGGWSISGKPLLSGLLVGKLTILQ